jgi:RNA polymerase sigma-70 factor (ECF subfamily)
LDTLRANALAGRRDAVVALVDLLTPVIRARVSGVLRRGARGRDVTAAVEDVTQQVLLVLFADGGKVLRTWDPARGLTLTSFVGLVAKRQALAITRTGRSSPFTEDPTEASDLDARPSQHVDLEEHVASREFFLELAQRLRQELTPYGMQMFELLFIQERTSEQICADLDLSPDAVYAWRSRLIRAVRAIGAEIVSEGSKALRRHGGMR